MQSEKVSMERVVHLNDLLIKVPKEVVDFINMHGHVFDTDVVEIEGKEYLKGRIFFPYVLEGVYGIDEPILKTSNFLDKENEFILNPNYERLERPYIQDTYSGDQERVDGRYAFAIVPK